MTSGGALLPLLLPMNRTLAAPWPEDEKNNKNAQTNINNLKSNCTSIEVLTGGRISIDAALDRVGKPAARPRYQHPTMTSGSQKHSFLRAKKRK